jgi:sugar porter (SP) family MFS transporter
MAGGPVTPIGPVKRYNAKVTVYVWIVCILGGCGGLLLGYDNGVIGGVTAMPAFQYKFFRDIYNAEQIEHIGANSAYCKYNNQILQLIVSVLYLTAIVAGLLAAPFSRLCGRRPPLIVAGIFFMAGAALMAGAENKGMLIGGRILLGVGVGFASLVMPMYNAEMAPPQLRGAMNILFQLNVTIGILAAGLINYGGGFFDKGWRMSLGLAGVPGLIVFIGGIILPESPNSLIERGHLDKARVVLERVRGTKDVQEEFDDLVEAGRLASLVKNSLWNLCKPQYRPQLVISLVFMLCQQFAGINAIIFYAPVLFSSLGSGKTASLLNTVIIGAVNVCATLVAVAFVDKVGRKFLLIAGAIQMIICEIIVGVTLKYEFGRYGATLPNGPSIGVLVVICVYIAGFAWSWGPIGWLYPTEIQPLETRAAGASLNVASNMLFTFVIAQCFVTMLCTMQWGVFLFFAGCVVLMMLWVIFLLPETKGLPIEDVFRLFQRHWFWSRASKIGEVHNPNALGHMPVTNKSGYEGGNVMGGKNVQMAGAPTGAAVGQRAPRDSASEEAHYPVAQGPVV